MKKNIFFLAILCIIFTYNIGILAERVEQKLCLIVPLSFNDQHIDNFLYLLTRDSFFKNIVLIFFKDSMVGGEETVIRRYQKQYKNIIFIGSWSPYNKNHMLFRCSEIIRTPYIAYISCDRDLNITKLKQAVQELEDSHDKDAIRFTPCCTEEDSFYNGLRGVVLKRSAFQRLTIQDILDSSIPVSRL